MIPRILLDKAKTPDGGKEISLYQHDRDFSLSVGNIEIMNSRMHESEEALARLALARMEEQEKLCVLIGGLGMGFTLRAALDGISSAARVVVAELVPAVVTWNRGVLGALAGHPLDDKRVEVREIDAAKMIKGNTESYDAILLDVDNGPAGLSRHGNYWFYGLSGLTAILAALRPGGVLALWSAGQDHAFTRRMEEVGFEVETIRVRARAGGKGAHHLIWIAKKTGDRFPKGDRHGSRMPSLPTDRQTRGKPWRRAPGTQGAY